LPAPQASGADQPGFIGIRQEVEHENAFRTEPRDALLNQKANEALALSSTRRPEQRLHSRWAILSPIPSVEVFRHEGSGLPFEPINALPGPQDPNDASNHAAAGTSSLRTYRLTPFWRSGFGRSTLPLASSSALSAIDAQAVVNPQTAETSEDAPKLQLGFQIRP